MKIYMIFTLLGITSSIVALGKNDKHTQQPSSSKQDLKQYIESKQTRDKQYKRNAIHTNNTKKTQGPWISQPPRKKQTP